MRLSTSLLVGFVVVGACGKSALEQTAERLPLASLCLSIVEADPAARADQIASGMLAKTCDCYAEAVTALDPKSQRTHVAVWEAMNALTTETGMEGVEALGGEMMSRIDAAPDTYEFGAGEFSEIGRFVGTIGNHVDATGNCPKD